MLHHEEYPEKPQYNMTTPPPISRQTPPHPFCPTPAFLSKIFRLPISINFEKVKLPPAPLYEGGGGGGSNYDCCCVNQLLLINHKILTSFQSFISLEQRTYFDIESNKARIFIKTKIYLC